MNLIQALARFERVANEGMNYGWLAYDETGLLKKYNIRGESFSIIPNRSLIECETFHEYKPTLKALPDPE